LRSATAGGTAGSCLGRRLKKASFSAASLTARRAGGSSSGQRQSKQRPRLLCERAGGQAQPGQSESACSFAYKRRGADARGQFMGGGGVQRMQRVPQRRLG